jgi:hypothetical protein
MHKFHSIAALCGDGLRPELRSYSRGWRLIRTLGCTSAMTAWSKPDQIPFPRRPPKLNTEIQELAICRRKLRTRRS